MWPFRRTQELKPEQKAGPVDGRTPITNLLKDMMAGGWSQDAIILAVHTAEQNAFRLLRAYQLDRQAAAVQEQPAERSPRRTKGDKDMSSSVPRGDISMSPAETSEDTIKRQREIWAEKKRNQRLKRGT